MKLRLLVMCFFLSQGASAAELLDADVNLRVTLEGPYLEWSEGLRNRTATAVRDALLEHLNAIDLVRFHAEPPPGEEEGEEADEPTRLEVVVDCDPFGPDDAACEVNVWFQLVNQAGTFPPEETVRPLVYAEHGSDCAAKIRRDREADPGHSLKNFLRTSLKRLEGFSALVDALSWLKVPRGELVPDARYEQSLYWVIPSGAPSGLDVHQLIFRVEGTITDIDARVRCSADFDLQIPDDSEDYARAHWGKWRLEVLDGPKGTLKRYREDEEEDCREAMVEKLEELEPIEATLSVIDFKGIPAEVLLQNGGE